MKKINMIGNKYGRLEVLDEVKEREKGHILYNCVCDCGGRCKVFGFNLRNGHTVSCGCKRKEDASIIGKNNKTHGQSSKVTPAYSSWKAMKERCLNPNATGFEHYGGRGITICPEWIESFEAFFADMGPREKHQSIDRILVDGNYEPGNCRWATAKEQNNNQRRHQHA